MGLNSEHSALAPSSMERRVHCRGSFNLEGLSPQEDTPESREGTGAHEVAAHMLRTGELLPIGFETSTAVLADAAMLDGAMTYTQEILRHLTPNVEGGLHIEERVLCREIHELCWGTPDCWFYKLGHLYVFDYKYGHDLVEIFENWQLLTYLFGITEHLELNGLDEQTTTVHLIIVQPRAHHRDGPIREWTANLANLRGYRNTLQQVAIECLLPDAPTTAGPWCLNCAGAYRCGTLQKNALAIASAAGSSTPLDMTPAQISGELHFLETQYAILKARVRGLEQQAISLAVGGAFLPNHQLSSTRPVARWKTDVETVRSLGALFGISLDEPAAVVSPSRAKKMGIDESVILEYSESPPGARKLVPVDTNQLRKIFQ